MEKKLTNSGPLREPADKHSIYTIEIAGRKEMRVQGVGHRRCQVELRDLLPHIPRNKLDRGLHFGKHALGFGDALQARLAEPFVLGNSAHSVNLLLDISRNELPIVTHTSLHIDKV